MPERPPKYRPHSKRPAADAGARPCATERGYDWRWQKFRKPYLAAHPLCVTCRAEGRGPVEATCIDHIDGEGPHGARGYDESNLQALCKPCHDRKTVTQDGGFGRAPQTQE
jgi:5-methylcytosine-specific restriction enzyme A